MRRKLSSFRINRRLLEGLESAASRTHRTQRQVLEITLQRVLPLIESGFLDSPNGRQLIEAFEESERRRLKLVGDFRASAGMPSDDVEKSNAPAVFRLDPVLAERIKEAARISGRSERAIVEICLRWGVPTIELWLLLEPHFEQIKADWKLIVDAASNPMNASDGSAQRRIQEASARILGTAFSALGLGEKSEIETVVSADKNLSETLAQAFSPHRSSGTLSQGIEVPNQDAKVALPPPASNASPKSKPTRKPRKE